MNERIRQLVKQSGGHFSTHNLTSNPVQHRESIELWDKNIEKFAELIVKECAHLVGGYTKENEFGTDVKEAYEEITKHFGVEE
jgi:hypothetical protein